MNLRSSKINNKGRKMYERKPAINCFNKVNLICYVCLQIFELCSYFRSTMGFILSIPVVPVRSKA